jgi:uncharacterized membrane protein (DUF485 family)
MIGIGGLLGALIVVCDLLDVQVLNWFLVFVMVAGIVGYARLNLMAHSAKQVYFGLLLGFGVQLFALIKLF